MTAEETPVVECLGSGRYVRDQEPTTETNGTWKGCCPDCGESFSLGYGGLIPVHHLRPTALLLTQEP